MSSPPLPPPAEAPQDQPRAVEVATIAALAALLASAAAVAAPAALLLLLLRILRPFGIGRSAAWTAWKLTRVSRPSRTAGTAARVARSGPATRAAQVAERTYHAAYLLGAARRIQSAINLGEDLDSAVRKERAYGQAHQRAAANRLEVAADVDDQARLWGPVLGWYTVLDDRTSADCRRANGKNFLVAARPPIGWPGSVHPHCRCRPGPPHATRALVGGGRLPVDWVSQGPHRRVRAGAGVG